ncbi:hypothetical protein PENTCL1PPCAC_20452, partial [Pristionchus entomophagus]
CTFRSNVNYFYCLIFSFNFLFINLPVNPTKMDILKLPDVFLRDLLKYIEIKDRMRLRLTCRAFEELVADTHAGYFNLGFFSRDMNTSIFMGTTRMIEIDFSDEQLEELIDRRQRLYTGITFGNFQFMLDGKPSTMEFLREFTKKWKIENISFVAHNEQQLESSLQLLSNFPGSEVSLALCFHPGTEKLLSLQPMDILQLYPTNDVPRQISVDFFFTLLSKHKNLILKNLSMLTSADWKRVSLIISEEARERSVILLFDETDVQTWLNEYGFTASAQAGDTHGEFEIIKMLEAPDENDDEIELRYRKCKIMIGQS